MKLSGRLLLGALAVVAVQVIVVVLLVQQQLSTQLQADAVEGLTREARLVDAHWTPGVDPVDLARIDGRAIGHRVTLIRFDGVVVGDTDFDRDGVAQLDNHSTRPEVLGAAAGNVGVSTRRSPSRNDEELYVAIKGAQGVTRVSMPAFSLTAAIDNAQRVAAVAGALSLVIALSLRELSDQLAARDAAHNEYEALLEQLTESLNEGVVGVDEARRVVRINDTGRRLLNIRDPLPFSVDLIPRDRALRDALDAAFKGDTTEDSETVIHGRTVNVTARPLASGGVVLALFDLTRVRRLESVRRDFVANVSHELRTPLTIVSGYAETLVGEDPDPERRHQFAERILANTQRMQRIVDDLLDLSRIESGGWVPNPEAVDLDVVAAEAIAGARDTAADKHVSLGADIAADARTVHADVTAVRQVLGNLVNNAVRHTKAGSVTVFSRATPAAIEIGVRDTGSGIAPEHLPRIFERFYRADPGRSRDEGGTGLGLAVVRLLVDAHGGHVRAESVVGVGTTVTAEFPSRTAL